MCFCLAAGWQILQRRRRRRRVQCESKNPLGFSDIFRKRLGIFSPNFTHLLHVPIYAGLQIFLSNYLRL